MPRITRVYTRGGDDGTTALIGGRRLPKDDLRIEAYGTVDELSAQLGAAVAAGPAPRLLAPLRRLQNELFHLGCDLATPAEEQGVRAQPGIGPGHVDALERLIDELSAGLPPLDNFVLAGGTVAAAQLHLARTVCRRAERLAVRLARRETVATSVLVYLNRLSDALFVLARAENAIAGQPDVLWDSRA